MAVSSGLLATAPRHDHPRRPSALRAGGSPPLHDVEGAHCCDFSQLQGALGPQELLFRV